MRRMLAVERGFDRVELELVRAGVAGRTFSSNAWPLVAQIERADETLLLRG